MAMLLVAVSVVSAASAVEIDSASLLQSRSQKATTQGTVLHSQAYLDAAVARKNEAPPYFGSPTVIAESNSNGCQGLDRSIDNSDECKQVALVHNKTLHKVGSWTDRPGGCFAIQLSAPSSNLRSGRVYFNQDPGSRETNSAPICKEAVCDFYECPQHYTKKWSKSRGDWTLNPSAEVCCNGLCTVPSTPGYDLAAAGGELKITSFGPTGLSCANGHVGSAVASVCSAPGAAYTLSGCQAVCTAPSTTGYDFNVATGALTIDGFGVGLSCAAGYTGSATPSVCLSPGAAYSVTGCEPTCNTPTMAGYDFASAGGAVTITGFGPTGLTCAMGYVGLVTASACSLPGIAYSVTGCEPTCKVHGCSAGYVDKGGVESTANPSDEVCCEPACTAPSAAGYNFATSAGVLKIAEFGPTGLTCASGYVGSAMASVCSSPGAAYSLTGCEPTCAVYKCPAGLVKSGKVESSTNLSDKACCFTSASSGPFVYHWNVAPLTQVEASRKCKGNGQVLAGIYTREEQLLANDIQAEAQVWSWIGIDDRNGGRGNFYTSEDVPVVYTNWNRNEPNNLNGEDCVNLYTTGTWNDLSCNTQLHGYFCRLPEDRGRSMGGFSWYSGQYDYEQARSKCEENGQVLASIYSKAENDDARKAMSTSSGSPTPRCVDASSYQSSCSTWRNAGYCARSSSYQSFMKGSCCATCNFRSTISSWLGMDDKGRNGRFHTSDGLRLSFTNWADRQPDNSGDEDCVVMLAGARWNDVRCDNKRPVLCRNVTSDIE